MGLRTGILTDGNRRSAVPPVQGEVARISPGGDCETASSAPNGKKPDTTASQWYCPASIPFQDTSECALLGRDVAVGAIDVISRPGSPEKLVRLPVRGTPSTEHDSPD